jgi:hypothetical protein
MFNRGFLDRAAGQIDRQIRAMPSPYTSVQFYSAFQSVYPTIYGDFIRVYTRRGHDRAHATKIVNAQLMHTVQHCFHSLTTKVQTVANPKGGDMSEWVRF